MNYKPKNCFLCGGPHLAASCKYDLSRSCSVFLLSLAQGDGPTVLQLQVAGP